MGEVVCINHGISGSSGAGATYTTEQICPEPNRLLLLSVNNTLAGTPSVPTVTGCGLTWVQIDTHIFDTGAADKRQTLFRAMGSAAVAGRLSIAFGGVSQTNCGWDILEFANVDTSGSDGSGAVVQAVKNSGTATTGSVTLAAFGNANNATVGFFTHSTSETVTAGTGFTRVHNNNFLSQGYAAIFRSDNDTSVDASWTTSSAWGGMAVEIKQGTAPAVPTSLPTALGDSTGTNYYVSYLNGLDANNGLTRGTAKKTINGVMALLTGAALDAPSITINLMYDGGSAHRPSSGQRITLQTSGASASAPITIQTDPDDDPDVTTESNMALFEGEFLVGGTSNRVYGNYRFRNLEIVKQVAQDNATSGAGDYGIRMEGARNVEVSGCSIHDNNQGSVIAMGSVNFCRAENIQVFRNRLYDAGSSGAAHNASENHDHGIYWGASTIGGLYGGGMWNNLVYRCYHGFTIHMWGDGGNNPSCKHSIMAFNTCYDTQTTGGNSVAIIGGSGTLGAVGNVVTSNILVKSGTTNPRYAMERGTGANGSGNLVKYNLPNEIVAADPWDSVDLGAIATISNNLAEVDPEFTDAAGGDFRIPSDSPAVDAGEAAYMPLTDFYGAERITTDIGAVAATVDPPADDPSRILRLGRPRERGLVLLG